MMRIVVLTLLLCCTVVRAQARPAKLQIDVRVTFLQFKAGPAADKFKADLEKANSEKGLVLHGGQFDLMVKALKMQRGTKVLAEPTIQAGEGQDASFLAGGEAACIADFKAAKKADGTIEYEPVTQSVEFGTKVQVRADVAADKKSLALDVTAGIYKFLGVEKERWAKGPADRDDLKIQKPKLSGIESKVKTTVSEGDALVMELRSKNPAASTQPLKLGIANAVVDADNRVIVILRPQIVVPKSPENAL